MDEARSPFSELWLLLVKDLGISDSPDVPTCSEDHLSKKGVMEVSFSSYSSTPHGWTLPCDLQVIPDPGTEKTVEE